MPLTVEVISYRGQPPVEPLEASFGQEGGTLGRSTEKRKNHFILPDPEQYISREHASISFENGLYSLTDTSVDGTYIQNKNIRVYRETIVLANGDRIKIGDYELIVHIPSIDPPETAGHDWFNSNEDGASDSFFDRDEGGPKKSSGEDGLWWYDKNNFEESAEQSYTAGQAEDSPLHDAITPPDIADDPVQPREIPKNFNFNELFSDLDEPDESTAAPDPSVLPIKNRAVNGNTLNKRGDLSDTDRRSPNNAVPTPAMSTEKSSPADSETIEPIRRQAQLELLRVFLEATGVKDTNAFQNEDIFEMMKTVGLVFREMIDGLMAILRGRTELKSQLQVSITSLKPTENNPLKFYRIVDETIKQFLINDQPGFVDAKDAVREGYADVMNHQLAITAGVQAAVIRLIERFDPRHYAKQFEEGVVFQKKAKAWDAFRQAYAEIADEALEDFFGESFAQAYEEQIRKLRSNTNDS